jgi:hypothetical protein
VFTRAPQVAALEDKVAGQQGLSAEQGQRMRDMEVGWGGHVGWVGCVPWVQ